MSHELRTPLNAILAFSEILHRELFGQLGDPRYREYAGDIHSSGEHLLDLINDILDLSRIEAGRYELRFEPVDIGAVVRASCDVMREQMRVNGLRLRMRVSKDIPTVRADPRAVRQILLNLLSNALKFTPGGGEVRVQVVALRDDQVSIRVSDTGIGIAPEDLEIVRTPFAQVSVDHVAGEGGTGLGLSIVDGLVALHGGTLEIDSTVGKGTRVIVRLPPSGN